MKLIFVCLNQNKVFETADYRIVENKGVISDMVGNKTLDAKVASINPVRIAVRNIFTMSVNYPVRFPDKKEIF